MSGLKQEYTKEEVIQLDETFQQLRATPAWATLTSLIEGMKTQIVLAGLADYKDPAEVAVRHGLYMGYSAILELPERFRVAAERHRQEELKLEREKEEEEARHIRRATTEGEVAF
jgi:hypothetical protein